MKNIKKVNRDEIDNIMKIWLDSNIAEFQRLAKHVLHRTILWKR